MLLIFIKITLKHSVVSAVEISLNELTWSFHPVNFTCGQLESRHFGDTTSLMGSAFLLLEYWPDSYQNYSAGNLEVDYQKVAKIAKFHQQACLLVLDVHQNTGKVFK